MAKAALNMRQCQRKGARRRAGFVIFLGECVGGFTIRGHASREREPYRSAWRQANPLPEACDRIEHDARCAGQRSAVKSQRVRETTPAAKKPPAIGFPLDGALGAT